MSMNTPIGGINQTTPIKNFREISELDNDQYLLGIENYESGSGGKVKFATLINDSISADNDNIITKGTDNKLLVNTPSQIGNLNSLTTTNKSTLVAAINEVDGDLSTEATTRSNADNNLQSQIDAITAASDVTDVVGTYVQLQAYDTTGLAPNSIIKVLQDESQGNATTYYRWVITGGVGAWTLIGSEGPYYTKSQSDSKFATQVTTGSLSNLDTTDKSSLVGAINEIAALTPATSQRDYIDNSKAMPTGEVSTNSIILPEIINYAHSTFDRSKFTVVGSLNIMNDGIASGFGSNNYVTLSSSITLGEDFELYLPVTYPSDLTTISSTTNAPYRWQSGTTFRLLMYASANGSISFNMSDGTNSLDTPTVIPTGTMGAGESAIIVIKQKNQTCTYGYIKNGIYTQTGTKTNYPLNMPAIDNFWIGKGASSSYWAGSIDLKQFSITVDGVEVFSGNKTGIDTIKPDDYTVVGTPTISADGVAGVFSNSNYITASVNIDTSKAWEITQTVNCTNIAENTFGNGVVDGYNSSEQKSFYAGIRNSNLYLELTGSNGNIQSGYITLSSYTFSNNTDVNITLGWDLTKYYIKINGTQQWSISSTTPLRDVSLIEIGTRKENRNAYFNGSIDLNAFKIYVDGDLIYQPCLKIPYTESKTGSKIVDSIYRDRVNDMAELFGYANYYTLGENDFTLPMGEIYGMIENAKRTGFLGQTIFSLDPLFDDGLHLLDGSLLSGDGVYKPFIDNYIKPLLSSNPSRFVTEATWQQCVLDHGVCGYYVYDSANNTLRLPKVTGFVEGTLDASALGSIAEAGLPNITGTLSGFLGAISANPTGAFYDTGSAQMNQNAGSTGNGIGFDASRSSSIYKNGFNKVQPQAIRGYLYIILANNVNGSAGVDNAGVITDLNNKAGRDLVNVNNTGTSRGAGWAMPSSTAFVDITLGDTGTNYTAPANGYFTVTVEADGSFPKYVELINNYLGLGSSATLPSANYGWIRVFVPAQKGQTVSCWHNNVSTHSFRFIYAQGSESEAS